MRKKKWKNRKTVDGFENVKIVFVRHRSIPKIAKVIKAKANNFKDFR